MRVQMSMSVWLKTRFEKLIAIPDISPIILRATSSVDWSRVLAMAMAYDIVDLAKAIGSQQQTIFSASDDILLDVMDVLRSVRDATELSDAYG
jgi:hypothetical protein